jgi:DNA-binding beta-propeller fold protein YncE
MSLRGAGGLTGVLAVALAIAVPAALARGSAHGALEQPAGKAGCASETGHGGSCSDLKGLLFPTAIALSPAPNRDVYVTFGGADYPSRGIAHLVAAVPADPKARPLELSQPLGNGKGCISNTGNTDGAGACAAGRALSSPASVAVSPDGRNVYVASGGSSDAVVVFARNPRDGELAQLPGSDGCVSETGGDGCADGKGLDGPASVAVSPDGKNVYLASGDGVAVFGRVLGLRENASPWGRLIQLPGSAGCVSETASRGACADGRALSGANSVTVSPDGKNVYVASTTSQAVAMFTRDSITGGLTQLKGKAGCVSDTGSRGECAHGRGLKQASSVAVSPDGRNVYVAAKGSSAVAVFAREPARGVLTQLPGPAGCVFPGLGCTPVGALRDPMSIAVSPDGRNVYVSSKSHQGALVVLAREKGDGRLTQLPGKDGCVADSPLAPFSVFVCAVARGLDANVPLAPQRAALGIAIRRDGRHLYVAATNAVLVFTPHR